MKKIKATTWIELNLMTEEQRAQLEIDYQAVIKDCDKWCREELDRKQAEIQREQDLADQRAAQLKSKRDKRLKRKQRRRDRRRAIKWWFADLFDAMSGFLFWSGLILGVLLVIGISGFICIIIFGDGAPVVWVVGALCLFFGVCLWSERY